MEALAKIDPAIYKDKIQIFRNGNTVLYGKANKAIDGKVRAAYLFWLDLTGSLKKWGFKANPYDWCTMNHMFGKNQCTIQWHVDDLKISCRNESAVESVVKKLSAQYGKIASLTITRRKVHDYLGIRIDYS